MPSASSPAYSGRPSGRSGVDRPLQQLVDPIQPFGPRRRAPATQLGDGAVGRAPARSWRRRSASTRAPRSGTTTAGLNTANAAATSSPGTWPSTCPGCEVGRAVGHRHALRPRRHSGRTRGRRSWRGTPGAKYTDPTTGSSAPASRRDRWSVLMPGTIGNLLAGSPVGRRTTTFGAMSADGIVITPPPRSRMTWSLPSLAWCRSCPRRRHRRPRRSSATIVGDPIGAVRCPRRRDVVGSLTLALYRIPTGLKAWIEDVVVDEAGAWPRRRRGAQPGRARRGSSPRRQGREPHHPTVAGGRQPAVSADRLRRPHHQRLPLLALRRLGLVSAAPPSASVGAMSSAA